MIYANELVLTPRGKRRFELIQPFARLGITVPAGFIFDGASIPRVLWFAFAPFEYLISSVLHDYGYSRAENYYERGKYTLAKEWFDRADTAFLHALKEDDRRVARLFYNAVRVYRRIKFPKANQNIAKNAAHFSAGFKGQPTGAKPLRDCEFNSKKGDKNGI